MSKTMKISHLGCLRWNLCNILKFCVKYRLKLLDSGRKVSFYFLSRGRVLGRNPEKSLKSFPPCFSQSPLHCRFYSFALRFLFLQTHATSYSFYSSSLLYTAKEKGGKPDRKPYLLPYVLWNPYRNLKSEIMPINLKEIVRSWIQLQKLLPMSCHGSSRGEEQRKRAQGLCHPWVCCYRP
jgi:hypothetical protein